MWHLEAKIVLELDAVHDGEHRGRGGAAHKEHLRGMMLLMMMQSLWMTMKLLMQRTVWMMMPTKLTTMEMRTSTSIRSSGLCRDFLGGKLERCLLFVHCTNLARIANAVFQGHLSRWTGKKAKSRSWQMEWVWLMTTCGLKLFERRHEVMLLEDFPVSQPVTRMIGVRTMLMQDISERWKHMFRHPI